MISLTTHSHKKMLSPAIQKFTVELPDNRLRFVFPNRLPWPHLLRSIPIILHFGSDYEDGIDCSGAFLWRLMIATPYQGKGYGQEAVRFIVQHLRAQGYRELFTSCGLGEGSPEGFYRRLGFEPTGDMYGDQIELVFRFPS